MAYRATLEEDAELLKKFSERTYGPIKRDPLAAFRPVQKRERPTLPPSSGRSRRNTCWWTATTSSLRGTS